MISPDWTDALDEIATLRGEVEKLRAALKLFRSLVKEGGVPRYTITPGAALNSVIEETVDPALGDQGRDRMMAAHQTTWLNRTQAQAAEIERLRAEVERLRAVLKTIADNDCAQRGCDVYEMAKEALGEQGKG